MPRLFPLQASVDGLPKTCGRSQPVFAPSALPLVPQQHERFFSIHGMYCLVVQAFRRAPLQDRGFQLAVLGVRVQ